MKLPVLFGLFLLFPIFTQAQNRKSKLDTLISPYGLKYIILKQGDGPIPKYDDKVFVRYKGWLPNGTVFDSTKTGKHFRFRLGHGEVIPGWDDAFSILPVGSVAKLFLRPEQGYGHTGFVESGEEDYLIPPDSPLIFEVEVLKVN